MSKAKELAKKAKVTNPYYSGDHLVDCIVFTEEEFAIFWSQLCKEQRELCQEYVESPWENMNEVPEPSIDD